MGFLPPLFPSQVKAQETAPALQATPLKELYINYKAYNNILKELVIVKKGTSRAKPKKANAPTGTRVSFVNKKITRLESNRVMFHLLKDEHEEFIRGSRQTLEALPNEIPLENFSSEEQLAFWLNLRNLVVVEALMDKYPIRSLKNPWKRLRKEKRLKIKGASMSINDIETLILTKWPHPLVIYGFYNGSVGGPNIRKRAFTGKFVWEDLGRNAKEFVNSLRGSQFYKKTAKISDFYKDYAVLFPDFDKDLKTHIIANMRPSLAEQLANSKKVKVNISDWNIADLMNGRNGLSSAGSIGPAALLNSPILSNNPAYISGVNSRFQSNTNRIKTGAMKTLPWQMYPAHVQEYLIGMQDRLFKAQGKVTIDEVYGTETDVPKTEQEKKEKKKN